MFCLNKSVNERSRGMLVVLDAYLLICGVPADLGQTLGKAKTNLSVSMGLEVLIRGPDSLVRGSKSSVSSR